MESCAPTPSARTFPQTLENGAPAPSSTVGRLRRRRALTPSHQPLTSYRGTLQVALSFERTGLLVAQGGLWVGTGDTEGRYQAGEQSA